MHFYEIEIIFGHRVKLEFSPSLSKELANRLLHSYRLDWTHRCSMERPKKLKTPNKFRTLLALIDLKVAREGVQQQQQQMQKQQQK